MNEIIIQKIDQILDEFQILKKRVDKIYELIEQDK